ncbi:hypothetical protein [Bartonella sp. AA89HNZF]|uniref:restriction endonuclease n=1 Tax=Bartonella sp. AA89HNZF TaxID=3243442 RepID=UPI0035D0B9CA
MRESYVIRDSHSICKTVNYHYKSMPCRVSEKSVYDHVVYESSVEKEFAQNLDNDSDVRLFFKLPRNLKIATPIGSYTPDWAVF